MTNQAPNPNNQTKRRHWPLGIGHSHAGAVYWLLGFLLLFASAVYLSSIPGLMGDEASEGQNVYEILNGESFFTVKGERSYIGPLIDYIRIPFVLTFGYTTLALRLPILLFSLATFLLAIPTFKRLFGEESVPLALAFFFFNPIYLTYQRLGWAITLLPFFFMLTLYFLTSKRKYKWLWTGLAAGLGLHTHILFLPTLVGIVAGALVYGALAGIRRLMPNDQFPMPNQIPNPKSQTFRNVRGALVAVLLMIVGLSAAFGSQFAVMQLWTEDQGDPGAVAEIVSDRIKDLPGSLQVYLSGSSYVARYTGFEFVPLVQVVIAAVIGLLMLLWPAWSYRRKVAFAWMVGIGVGVYALTYMVDRFSLRYFLMPVLAIWLAAGVSTAELIRRVFKHRVFESGLVGALAATFGILLFVWTVMVPFGRTGGSLNDFSLGNRTDSAAALVDTRALEECIQGKDVASENVHIYNRMLLISHNYPEGDINVEESAKLAEYYVDYRKPELAREGEEDVCPELKFFRVSRVRR